MTVNDEGPSALPALKWGAFIPELLSSVNELLLALFNDWKADKDTITRLADRRVRTKLPTHPLLYISLVNKHWSAVARKDLYACIFLHKEQTTRRLLRAVEGHGDLLNLIKSVTVDYKYNQLPTQKKALTKEKAARNRTSKLTWQLLLLLRPVSTVHLAIDGESLRPHPAEAPEDGMIPCITGLRSLAIEDTGKGHGLADHSPWVKAAAPTLVRLKVPLRGIGDLEGISLTLKSLCIPGPINDMSHAQFKALTKASQLEDLSLPFMDLVPPSVQHAELLRAAPKLQRLQFAVPYGTRSNRGSREDLVATLKATLLQCSSLRILNIWLREDDFAEGLASTIPTTVQHMVVGIESIPDPNAHKTIKSVLARVGQLILSQDVPALVTLRMTSVYLQAHFHTGVTVEGLDLPNNGVQVSLATQFPQNLPWLY